MKKNSAIKSIRAREILDSKGSPTVEVDLITDLGLFRAAVPSGISKGRHEARELRDGGKRYGGRGVLKAVKKVNEIIGPRLRGENVTNQERLDRILIELDGTKNKSRLGANSLLAVSLAICRAAAAAANLPLYRYLALISGFKPKLPHPCFLMLEGGLHAASRLKLQEFMIVLRSAFFKENLRRGVEIYQALCLILEKKYGKTATNVGCEGGFVPPLKKSDDALELMIKAAKKAGYGKQISIIIDAAASVFLKNSGYRPEEKRLNRKELLGYYSGLLKKYPLIGIEDPYAEDDWHGFKMINKKFGKKIFIIGDDLLTTNINRMRKAKNYSAANALVLKPNQAGTVSETIKAAKEAKKYGWQIFVKHRGGETNDDFIADLAVGLESGWIMAGAPVRGERIAKYNRLLEIEEELANHPAAERPSAEVAAPLPKLRNTDIVSWSQCRNCNIGGDRFNIGSEQLRHRDES